jgi:hypothetical protein
MKPVFSRFAQLKGVSVGSLRFLLDGTRLSNEHTPEMLGLEGNDTIDVMTEQATVQLGKAPAAVQGIMAPAAVQGIMAPAAVPEGREPAAENEATVKSDTGSTYWACTNGMVSHGTNKTSTSVPSRTPAAGISRCRSPGPPGLDIALPLKRKADDEACCQSQTPRKALKKSDGWDCSPATVALTDTAARPPSPGIQAPQSQVRFKPALPQLQPMRSVPNKIMPRKSIARVGSCHGTAGCGNQPSGKCSFLCCGNCCKGRCGDASASGRCSKHKRPWKRG